MDEIKVTETLADGGCSKRNLIQTLAEVECNGKTLAKFWLSLNKKDLKQLWLSLNVMGKTLPKLWLAMDVLNHQVHKQSQTMG